MKKKLMHKKFTSVTFELVSVSCFNGSFGDFSFLLNFFEMPHPFYSCALGFI